MDDFNADDALQGLLDHELSPVEAQELRAILRAQPHVTCAEDILMLPPSVLSPRAVSGLLPVLARHILNRPKQRVTDPFVGFVGTAFDLARRQEYLQTGDAVLDAFLSPGILAPGVTELTGLSSSGKTQLCMHLALSVQLPRRLGGLEGGCLYITTESRLHVERLAAMSAHFAEAMAHEPHNYLDHVIVESIYDAETLLHMLTYTFPVKTLASIPVRLLVVDSLAALFRGDDINSDMRARGKLLHSIGTVIKKLADAYSLAVVVVNQVSANMSWPLTTGTVTHSRDALPQTRPHYPDVHPTLGQIWTGCVNTRVMVTRHDRHGNALAVAPDGGGGGVLRTLHIVFSPYIPSSLGSGGAYCEFAVVESGIRGVEMVVAPATKF
ncbi:DNA repair protein rhp57 [Sorochytrium milnesiophthora]